jgi:hypothetical protein
MNDCQHTGSVISRCGNFVYSSTLLVWCKSGHVSSVWPTTDVPWRYLHVNTSTRLVSPDNLHDVFTVFTVFTDFNITTQYRHHPSVSYGCHTRSRYLDCHVPDHLLPVVVAGLFGGNLTQWDFFGRISRTLTVFFKMLGGIRYPCRSVSDTESTDITEVLPVGYQVSSLLRTILWLSVGQDSHLPIQSVLPDELTMIVTGASEASVSADWSHSSKDRPEASSSTRWSHTSTTRE